MRIALIAPPWLPVPPPSYGGVEAVVDRLARGFDAAGHDVLLYTTGDSTCPVPKASVYARSSSEQLGIAAMELRHLIHAYDAVQDYDLVHDHTVVGPVYAARFPRLRVVTTNHGPFNDELTDIYRSVAQRVPIIAISHAQAETAVDLPIARVIHHGLDPESFQVGPGDGEYLACVGRMNPNKGIVEAIHIARAAGARLKIAAKMREPAEQQYYESEVKPLLDNDAEYLGELGREDLHELVGRATALLNPIQWPEPFGLVMIEALACGTPVLVTRRGAAPEIVQDGVTGFVRDREEDLVEAVRRLPEIARDACRKAVEADFSTARMVRDHLNFFEDLAAPTSRLLRPYSSELKGLRMADTMSDFFQKLGERGHEPLLGHMRGAVRFDVRGDDGEVDQWVVAVDRGAVTVSHGHADADCAIGADRAVLERVIKGEEHAMAAVLRGALRCSGDVEMLLTIQRIFPGPSDQRPTVGHQGGTR